MWPDENGEWSTVQWTDPTGTVPYQAPQVQTNSAFVQQTADTAGQDRWSGWFQNLIGTGVNYAIQKDARQSGLVLATAPNGQPIYSPAGAPTYTAAGIGGISSGALLIVGAAIVAGLLLVNKG
jgi:hypothetical protein